jgi:predicted DNA-binding transcriptional regulator AlpA
VLLSSGHAPRDLSGGAFSICASVATEEVPMALDDVKLLSTKATSAATNLPPTTMAEMAKKGHFPQPIEIPGSRRLGWREVEIRAWLENLEHRPAREAV